MTGIHGIQRFLRNINGKTKFVPCFYHSLNLHGIHAKKASVITFFRVIKKLLPII